jgi:hypothetical protein
VLPLQFFPFCIKIAVDDFIGSSAFVALLLASYGFGRGAFLFSSTVRRQFFDHGADLFFFVFGKFVAKFTAEPGFTNPEMFGDLPMAQAC